MSSEHEEEFSKCTTKDDKWDTPSIYFMYNGLFEKGVALRIWLLPWPHFRLGITDSCGFVAGDASTDRNVIILDRYESKLKLMSLKIHNALNYKGDCLPQEGMIIIHSSNNYVYTSLHNMMRIFHPPFADDSTLQSNRKIPYQQENESLDAWSKRTEYHRAMTAFLDDAVMDLGNSITQNRYIKKTLKL